MCPRINLSSFSRCKLGTPLLKLLNCKRNNNLGVVRLHVNTSYFSTTARRVTSPTWGPPPPCKQALNNILCASNFLLHMFSNSKATIQTFLRVIFVYRGFFCLKLETNLSVSCFERWTHFLWLQVFVLFYVVLFPFFRYWVKILRAWLTFIEHTKQAEKENC